MKVMVMFDLPTTGPNQRQAYVKFRKRLLGWGFESFQESVYVKECDNEWHMKMVSGMVGKVIPAEGKVATCSFSDKQWTNTMQYEDGEKMESSQEPQQMVLML